MNTNQPENTHTAPTCRACHAATLTSAERERFYVEPVTACIYWCPDHQRAMDDALQSLPQVQYIQATMATFEPPMFALAEHDCSTCADCIHDGHKCCGCYDGACCQEVSLPPGATS